LSGIEFGEDVFHTRIITFKREKGEGNRVKGKSKVKGQKSKPQIKSKK
jgi:hypothetical protein